MSRDESGQIERNETPHNRLDILTDRMLAIEKAFVELRSQLKSHTQHPEDKYKLEQEFIGRYLIQQGYTVDEDALFETIVSIITQVKEDKVNNDKWRLG